MPANAPFDSAHLEERIRAMSENVTLADGRVLPVLLYDCALDLARSPVRIPSRKDRCKSPKQGQLRVRTLALVERTALALGICPERYLRNFDAYSLEEQLRLLSSQVAMIGLGGLGGYALELLARAGVGQIRSADGDEFVPSNLNRQLLSTWRSLGGSKAAAAATRIKRVNPAVMFEPVALYLSEPDMGQFIAGADLCLDALGGLKDRAALMRQASAAGIPLVTAAVAGSCGYVSTVLPGAKGPADFFGAGAGAEDSLGTPAPAVSMAASLMAGEALNILCGRGPKLAGAMLLFDLDKMSFETVKL